MGVRFGDAVRTARIERRIPLKRVADALEFSIPYVSDIERGHRNPPAGAKVRDWAGIIGLDPDELEFIALADRPRIELSIEGQRKEKVDLAFALTRTWDEMTEGQEQRLLNVLREMEDESR